MNINNVEDGKIIKVVGHAKVSKYDLSLIIIKLFPIGMVTEVKMTNGICPMIKRIDMRFSHILYRDCFFDKANDREKFLYKVVFGKPFVSDE